MGEEERVAVDQEVEAMAMVKAGVAGAMGVAVRVEAWMGAGEAVAGVVAPICIHCILELIPAPVSM
jgi:hypothetical protein